MMFNDPGRKKQFGPAGQRREHYPQAGWFKRLTSINLRAEAVVDLDDVVGEIDPRIYGHFIPAGDRSAGSSALIEDLHPPLLRAEVGDLSRLGHSPEVDFLSYCEKVGAEAYLALDVRRVTPEAAAAWVAYCKAPIDTEPGAQRAADGHPDPYPVRLWGLFIGDGLADQPEMLDPAAYVRQVKPIVHELRTADPEIRLVVAGKAMLPADPENAEAWNRTVLTEIGDQLDYLALRVTHPDGAADEDLGDPECLYHSLLSAPHSVEGQVQQLASLIRAVVPDREIGIVLDTFNLQLPTAQPAPTATLRDGLYLAGMLNAFQRQCSNLKVAAFAHPADAQPVIITPEAGPAFPTPLYFPYLLYREMEPQLLSVVHWSPVFQAEALGRNIRAYNQVSYIDLTATRSVDGRRVVLAVTNRNPHRQASVMVNLKGEDNRKFRTVAARLMAGPDPLAGPEEVGVRTVKPPKLRFTWLDLDLPPASLMVVTVEEKG